MCRIDRIGHRAGPVKVKAPSGNTFVRVDIEKVLGQLERQLIRRRTVRVNRCIIEFHVIRQEDQVSPVMYLDLSRLMQEQAVVKVLYGIAVLVDYRFAAQVTLDLTRIMQDRITVEVQYELAVFVSQLTAERISDCTVACFEQVINAVTGIVCCLLKYKLAFLVLNYIEYSLSAEVKLQLSRVIDDQITGKGNAVIQCDCLRIIDRKVLARNKMRSNDFRVQAIFQKDNPQQFSPEHIIA